MSRGFGVTELLSGLPKVVVLLAGVATQLGDAWFLLVGIATIYLLARTGRTVVDRPANDCLYLLAVLLGAYALTIVAKFAFGLPRPPGAETAVPPTWLPAALDGVYASLVTADGFGYPSGHALTATAVYGAGALTLTVWDRTRRAWAATAVVTVVGITRLVLGVHYLPDVVAGVAFGAVFLVVVKRTTAGDARRALALAVSLGVVAVVVAGTTESVLVAASAVVALLVAVVGQRISE